VTRIVAYVSDLLFVSRIEATLRAVGYDVATVEDVPSLETALVDADVAILDLHATDAPSEIIAVCTAGGVPVVAFGRHTEPELLRTAREAGAVAVVPRSTFVEEMVALVERAAKSEQRIPSPSEGEG
jgi:DNA-binding NarL/FixJ family response regulator